MRWCTAIAGVMILAAWPGKIFSDSGGSITLNEALSLSEKSNPQLKSARLAVDAQKSLVKQARLFPNPELEVETENFGQNEIEAGISQPIELFGKRSSRIKIAKKDAEKAELEYEIARRQLVAQVTSRFADILAWQSKLEQMDHAVAVAESSLSITKHQVQIGAAMEMDAIRTEIELSSLMIEKRNILRGRDQSMKHIQSLLGVSSRDFQGVSGRFNMDFVIPPFSELEAMLSSNPDLLIQTKEVDLSELEIKEARAEGLPDISVGAGYLRNNEKNESAPLVGISLDLPLFNRNQGAVREKRLRQQASKHEAENLRNVLLAELFETHSEIVGLKEQLAFLEEEVLPKAEKAYGQILKFYQIGKSGFLEVLALRKELIELHMSIIETKVEIVKLAAEIEQKANVKLSTIQ